MRKASLQYKIYHMNNRVDNELRHDEKILKNADNIWGREGPVGEFRIKRRAEMIIQYCGMNKNFTVLEIGCGTGTLTEYLAKTGAQITATDLSKGFLDLASQKIKYQNVSFQTANAERLDNFKDNSFDAVVGLSILHHLDIQSALKNIHRVLKSGGIMAFSEPNMLNPQIMIQKNIPFIKKMLGDSPDETAFFKWQARKLLDQNGFKNITVKPIDFVNPFITPRFLLNPMIKISDFLEKIPLVKEIAGSLFISARKERAENFDFIQRPREDEI